MGARVSDSELVADELLAPWYSCLRKASPQMQLFDCHTHVGVDLDGARLSVARLRQALALIDAQAVVFPLATRCGYRARNDRLLAAVAGDDRLVAFCRVDPRLDGVAEATRGLGRGACGIKLHPRAERFALSDPEVERIVALAEERRVPVIVHAGRGIPSLGRDALQLAAHHPGAPLILAHAAVSDLAWLWAAAPDYPNLFFDTAWWNVADLLALFALVPPGQILFASDAPYGRPVAAAALTLRVAQAVGLTVSQQAAVFGGQLRRLLAGEPPAQMGGASGTTVAAPHPLLERIAALLLAAGARATAGQQPDEFLELARLACEIPPDRPGAAVAASIRELLARYERHLATGPAAQGPRPPAVHFVFLAAAIARLPGPSVPTL